jgi:hypothetical protein
MCVPTFVFKTAAEAGFLTRFVLSILGTKALNGTRWNGHVMKIQPAKPDYLQKCVRPFAGLSCLTLIRNKKKPNPVLLLTLYRYEFGVFKGWGDSLSFYLRFLPPYLSCSPISEFFIIVL